MDLIAQIETAFGRPGQFALADAAAGEFQQQQRIVFAFRFIGVDQAGAPGHDFDDLVLFAEEIAGGFDGVAGEVVHGAASGLLHIPEVRTVRPAVGFARTHPEDAANATLLDRIARFDDAGREHFGLGVSVQRAGAPGGVEHGLGFFSSASERFGADLILSGAGQFQRDREMRFIGKPDDVQIDIGPRESLPRFVLDSGIDQRRAKALAPPVA